MDVAVLPRASAPQSLLLSRSMLGWLAGAGLLVGLLPSAIAQATFPFEREMLLDVRPLPGSRRVPMLEIRADGRAQVDLWCHSGLGLVEVAGTAIKFTLGAMREEVCTPERTHRDEELVATLAEVTQWQAKDDVLVLVGPKELRYRLSTH